MVHLRIQSISYMDVYRISRYVPKHLRSQWIRDREGFVLVYRTSSLSSFDYIQSIHEQIKLETGPSSHPIIIVGIKRDEDREISTEDGKRLANSLGCEYTETSASDNVEHVFLKVLKRPQTPTGMDDVEGGSHTKETDFN